MTLHMRQPVAGKEFGKLIDEAFLSSAPRNRYRDVVKRALDITLVLASAAPVLVVLAVLAIAISLDGGSPFYSQKRVGRYGKTFRMWKLRSMVKDADRKLEAYLEANPDARAEWDHAQKLRDDPRITPVGRFIRKTSLDELPQLWNVLVGDMAIVGPRPMMVEQQPLYPGSAYYALRPGLTGYWQISVRHESSFAQRAFFDAKYLRDVSFSTDMSVMWKTVAVVTKGTGC